MGTYDNNINQWTMPASWGNFGMFNSPQVPNWGGVFDAPYLPQTATWGNCWDTLSQSGSTPMSEEARAKKREELITKQEEIDKQKEEINKVETQTQAFKQNKEGNYEKEKKLSEATFKEKAVTVGSGLANGAFKLVEAFIPKKEDGKIDWGKAALRIGGAALAFGATFIPVVGPFISAGLLAAGAVSGGTLIAKGVGKAYKCCTDKNATLTDLKHATEDITEGGVIFAASVGGIKSMRASQGVTGFHSAAAKMAKTDLSALKAAKASGLGNFKAFSSVYKSNFLKVKNTSVKKEKFDNKLQDNMNQLQAKQNEITSNFSSDPKLKAFEEYRAKQYGELHSELQNTQTRTSWFKLNGKDSVLGKLKAELKSFRTDFADGKPVKIGSETYIKGTDDEIFFSKIAEMEKEFISPSKFESFTSAFSGSKNKSSKSIESSIKELVSLRQNSMKDMALRGKAFKSELDTYGSKSGNYFSNLWTAYKPNGKWDWTKSLLLEWPMLPTWTIPQAICKSSAAAGYQVETALTPTYHEGLGDLIEMVAGGTKEVMGKEQYEQAIAQLNTQKTAIESAEKNIQNQLNQLT